ncbi:protein of unknown function [Microbacterium sp. Nx66]|nr:protein of unknown function [Microbacterium sp. Nx66]
MPVDPTDLDTVPRGDVGDPEGKLRGLREGRGHVDARVVHRGETLPLGVPRALGTHRESRAAPVEGGAGIHTSHDAAADGFGQTQNVVDDGRALRTLCAHRDADGRPFRRQTRLVFAADGDCHIAHGPTLRDGYRRRGMAAEARTL